MTWKFLLIILMMVSLNISAALQDVHWLAITRDISQESDSKNKQEFEAAKQAFLHIKDEEVAKEAASYIEEKWKEAFGNEATVGSKTRTNSLMSLIRYPLMTKEQAKIAVQQILRDNLISQFLDEEGYKINIA